MSNRQALTTILVDDFGLAEIDLTDDASFEALGLDSLDLVEVTMLVDERLGVRIPDGRLDEIRTVGDAVLVVDELQAVAG